MAYRFYVTDALKSIANNTTIHVGINGVSECGANLTERFIDILYPKTKTETEIMDNKDVDADQIAYDIWKRANIGG